MRGDEQRPSVPDPDASPSIRPRSGFGSADARLIGSPPGGLNGRGRGRTQPLTSSQGGVSLLIGDFFAGTVWRD